MVIRVPTSPLTPGNWNGRLTPQSPSASLSRGPSFMHAFYRIQVPRTQLYERKSAVRIFLMLAGGLIAIAIVILGGMIAFGTENPPPKLASMNDPLEKIDFSDLPPLETVSARRGSSIAFRRWQPVGAPGLAVILVHGSAGSSTSLHPLGKAIAASGIAVYAPDIRGHGKTGRKGDIDYAQQLDDDLEDFIAKVKTMQPSSRLVLAGFSGGGGFALHAPLYLSEGHLSGLC